MSRAFITFAPSRHAAGRPSLVSVRVNVGTKAALIAPSENRSRRRFGMREATTNASIALPAPKSAARSCSRTNPRMRLVMVATPADAAARASVPAAYDGRAARSIVGVTVPGGTRGNEGRADGSGTKLAPHSVVHRAPVGMLAGKLRHHRFHHLAHVLDRCGTRFGDRGGHSGV